MSTIASFGLCSKTTYESFENLIEGSPFKETESLINRINSEIENSVSELENNVCAGEVFIALFEYFEIVMGINVRENMERKELGENWREITGDYDMIAFFEKEKIMFSSLAGTIDYDEVSQFMNDFFQDDCGDAGKVACDVFFKYLKKLDTNTVLIFRLF